MEKRSATAAQRRAPAIPNRLAPERRHTVTSSLSHQSAAVRTQVSLEVAPFDHATTGARIGIMDLRGPTP